MNSYPLRFAAMFVVIAVLMLVLVSGFVVSAQEPDSTMGLETVYITSPVDGERVSDIIMVTGAADFPDFKKFEVFLKSGDQLIWGATGFAPVINGYLANLDTKVFMDGTYQIVIRKVGSDSNYTDFFGPTITIENNLGAPLPHREVEGSLLYPPQSGYGLARIKNCTGDDLEFDYQGQSNNCSADNLWIMPKLQHQPLCTSVDALLKPCEYRGSSIALGDERGATFSVVVEAGKVYEFDYAGEGRLYISDNAADERASTDVGGLDPNDPARIAATLPESVQAVEASIADSTAPVAEVAPAANTSEAAADAGASPEPEVIAVPTASSAEQSTTETVLPESGQGTNDTNSSFIITAIGLILLMVVGGLVAMRRGRQATSQS